MGNAIRMTRSWGGIYRSSLALDPERLREVSRAAFLALLGIAFLYAASVGWNLIQELRAVKLYQLRQVFRVASVGDVLLLWAAYALLREFLRAMGRRRQHPFSE